MKKPTLSIDDGFVLDAVYASQRDNPDVSGLIEGTLHSWADCGPEMLCGIIEQDIKGAVDNAYVVSVIKDMDGLHPDSWGQRNMPLFRKTPWYNGGRLTQYVEAHALYAQYKTSRPAVVRKYSGTWNEVTGILNAGRQIGFCSQITGAGHFIRLVGVTWDKNKGLTGFYAHDPYGEADTRTERRGEYLNADGAFVWYPLLWLQNGRCWGSKSGADGTLTYFFTR